VALERAKALSRDTRQDLAVPTVAFPEKHFAPKTHVEEITVAMREFLSTKIIH
jgi:hypothetical protein